MFNPVQLGLLAAMGMFDLTVEVQLSVGRYVSTYVTPELFYFEIERNNRRYYSYGFGSVFGIYLMPMGKRLDGVYIRAVVGVVDSDWLFLALEGMLGYQAVFNSGFSLAFGVGARYYSFGYMNLSL